MILTVDLGTSVTKVVVWGEDGPVAVGRSPLDTTYGPGGRVEQDPDAWWRALVSACATCAASAPDALRASGAGCGLGAVTAIGFAAARQSFVPVTADGMALGPALLWSDRRAGAEASELARSLEASGFWPRRRTGMTFDAGSVACKVSWLARHEADRLRAARWLLTPRDLTVWRLTGTVVTDHTMASASGLYELGQDEPAAALVDRLPAGVAEMLPASVASDAVVGTLRAPAAAEIGLPSGIPVVVGAGDRACEVLGTGASAQRPMVSWGTTANVSVPVDGPLDAVPEALVVTRGARGGYLLEGGLAAAGALADWLARLTGIDTDTLAHHARSSPPGANGVVVLPWFGGARAPWWRADARGAVVGLALDHHLGDVARAVVEAVAWDVARCLEAASCALPGASTRREPRPAPGEARMSGTARRESGEVGRSLPFDGLALGGGGATVALWTDILTGVTGLPARRRRSGEAASAGAALLVACNGADVGFDAHAALDRLDPVVADIPADPGLVAQYSARRAVADAAAGAVIEIGFP